MKTRTVKFFEPMLKLSRDGPARMMDPLPAMAEREQYHVAVIIPPFRRGSGGHNSIFQMLSRLERKGHAVSIWVNDPDGESPEWPAVIQRSIGEFFAPFKGPVFKGFADWYGADVVLATSWDTVHRALLLDQCLTRAYLVHDHESQFHPTSVESYWAEQTYSLGLHAICGSPWIAQILRRQHGATTSIFDFGVDHSIYSPRETEREPSTVLFYSRDVTPRRAVPLGLLALHELVCRRPDTRVITFGDDKPPKVDFPVEHLGIVSPDTLADAYSKATVGLVLSMTNYSLIPQEMLACGLPCVDLAGFSAESVFGSDGPVLLTPFDPLDLCVAVERLFDQPSLWREKSEHGKRFVADRTWDRAAQQLEDGIRRALDLRQSELDTRKANGAVRSQSFAAIQSVAPLGADANSRSVPLASDWPSPVAERLYRRLTQADVKAVEESMTPQERQSYELTPTQKRPHLILVYGVWYRVPGVLEKTGLSPADPPEHIHAMSRGPLAAGGDHHSADFIVEALGGSLVGINRALDFGCSSGRSVRSLAAAFPEIEWHGVDPNKEAIEWAAKTFARISFAVSSTEPPLQFDDDSLDLVFAISIWSHFDEHLAGLWLDEMHRVTTPHGRLVLTLHGYQSVQFYAQCGIRPPAQLQEIRRALYHHGFWYAPEFGEEGDHGVKHPGWGTAFMSPEWLLRRVTPKWSVERYMVGRNSNNQDVVVLRKS